MSGIRNISLGCYSIRTRLNYITASIGFSIGICMCYVYYRFTKTKHKGPTWMKYLANIFCISAIMSIFLRSAFLLELATCDYLSLSYWILKKTAASFYIIQAWLMLLLFYQKITLVFIGSIHQLTRRTVRFYRLLFMIFLIIGCIVPMLQFFVPIHYHQAFVRSIAYLSYVMTMISLSILFIYKLYKVYRIEEDMDIMKIMTKLTILTVSSIAISFLCAIALAAGKKNHIFEVIMDICIFIDVFSNQLFFVLTYKDFDKFYSKICGGMHKGCHDCIQTRVMNNEDPRQNGNSNTLNQDSTNLYRDNQTAVDYLMDCGDIKIENSNKLNLRVIDPSTINQSISAASNVEEEVKQNDANDDEEIEEDLDDEKTPLTKASSSPQSMVLTVVKQDVTNSNKLNLRVIDASKIKDDAAKDRDGASRTPSITQSTAL